MGEIDKRIHTLFGPDVRIVKNQRVSGGCINDTAVLTLSNQNKIFLKKNTREQKGMFEAEAIGLETLIHPNGPRVPQPIEAFCDASHQYLFLEYLHPAERCSNFWEQFGFQLAKLHQSVRSKTYGFEINNYIGATPQQNTPMASWLTFFAEMRLAPQVKMAARILGTTLEKKIRQLISRIDHYIGELDGDACILHGDLWSGNAMVGPKGEPVIIDPATYFGHREADIAMTRLFGQFGGNFYEAYNECWPLAPGWQERMDFYNLYHMLNHVNLFGAGYVSSVSSIVNRYL